MEKKKRSRKHPFFHLFSFYYICTPLLFVSLVVFLPAGIPSQDRVHLTELRFDYSNCAVAVIMPPSKKLDKHYQTNLLSNLPI